MLNSSGIWVNIEFAPFSVNEILLMSLLLNELSVPWFSDNRADYSLQIRKKNLDKRKKTTTKKAAKAFLSTLFSPGKKETEYNVVPLSLLWDYWTEFVYIWMISFGLFCLLLICFCLFTFALFCFSFVFIICLTDDYYYVSYCIFYWLMRRFSVFINFERVLF